jgi:endonuclease/exonuclease/phosphatase (EEP) superfamily protein YafD
VASAATLVCFLGRYFWFFDLFSHFRVQYLLGLVALAGLLLLGRWWKSAAFFLAMAAINGATVLPLYFEKDPAPAQAAAEAQVLRAMLLNVHTELGDPERVKALIIAVDPDLLVLQEINAAWMTDLVWLEDVYPHIITEPREDNFGIGFYTKIPLMEGQVTFIGEAEVPSVVATLRIPQSDLRVIATHPLPPSSRKYAHWRNQQLEELAEVVQSPLPVLLLGDLNVTPWSYNFRRLLAESGLRDSARGYGVQPTWPTHIPLLRIPIDHCLHSEGIVIRDRALGENVSSDHFPLIVDFAVPRVQG